MSTTHLWELGGERRSGRTTLMLAMLRGTQLAGIPSLYVCSSQSLAAYARAQSKHEIRCIGYGTATANALAGIEAIGLDDTAIWTPKQLEPIREFVLRRNLKLIIRSY